MLIDFRMKNFKSFYNETDISLVADNTKQEYKERLIEVNGKGKAKKKILPAMVIYGSNASGKTTIINALQTMKEIILNGTIKTGIDKNIDLLDISSFIHDIEKRKEPIVFDITFKNKLYTYNYKVGIKLVSPNEFDKKHVDYEEFNIIDYIKTGSSIKEKKINLFKRVSNKVILNTRKEVLEIYEKHDNYIDDLKNKEIGFNENLDTKEIFLTNSFKGSISLKITSDVIDWFENKLITIIDFSTRNLSLIIPECDLKDNEIYCNNVLAKLVNMADFGPQKIGYASNEKDGNNRKYKQKSAYKIKGINGNIIIDSDLIESRGTRKLIDFSMEFIQYFDEGGVFVLDEFDASIHPELVGGIIDLFNNKEVNKNNAQLIFNTHNPLFLQKRFFRRDQIMFVEKNSETYMSSVYKLSDFDTRNDKNYMKNYFEGKFGAIPFVDFEYALIEDIASDKKTK